MRLELTFLDIALAILAAYRLAQLVSKDDGPLDIFKRFRLYTKKRTGYYQGVCRSESLPVSEQFIASYLFELWRNIASWAECPYCNGVWFAALCLIALLPPIRQIGLWLIIWLAIAGGQAFLQQIGDK